MTTKASEMRREGLRDAARDCRLLVAIVLALSALAILAFPASDALAREGAIAPPAIALHIQAACADASCAPDGDVAHQCPQCAGHQVMMTEERPVTVAVRVSQVRFPVLARAAAWRATAPPHEPPRA